MKSVSRTTYYRRKRRSKELGISVEELLDGRGNHGNHTRGSDHHKWNDDLISSDGYRLVRVGITHPLACPNGYAYEHQVVWASSGRVSPLVNECIHHKNRDSLDNRLENLELMLKSEHNRLHNKDRIRDDSGRFT